MISWNRGEKKDFNKYFSTLEFECQCGKCDGQQVSPILLDRLYKLRADINEPIKIVSGFRCSERQKELRDQGYQTAVGISQHELGGAVDIGTEGHDRDELIKLCKKYFNAVGIAHSFIHVDIRDDKKREWYYT